VIIRFAYLNIIKKDYMRKLVLLFFVLASLCFGFEHSFIGLIGDDENQPLIGANLTIEELDIGTASDGDGNFRFSNIPNGVFTLTAQYVGFESHTEIVTIPLEKPLLIQLIPDLLELESIVVTGTRTERYLKDVPVTTQVLRHNKINESGAINLSEALDRMTGVSIVENQFGHGIELCGFDSDHVLVLIDGMKLIGRTNGQLDVSQIPVNQIERIEVVKGANSALYGSEAMGGVVNIITKKLNDTFNFKIGGALGSFGKLSLAPSIQGSILGLNAKLNINTQTFGKEYLYPVELWENGSSYVKNNYDLTLNYTSPFWGTSNIKLLYFSESQSQDLNIFNDITENIRSSIQFGNRLNIYDFDIHSIIETSEYDHIYKRIKISSGFKKTNDQTIDALKRYSISINKQINNHLISCGNGYEAESIISDRVSNNNQNSTLYFGFVQDEYQFTDKLTFLSGVRHDYHSIYGKYYSPKFSIMFKPEFFSRIRFSYGEGFRAPSFKELYLDFTVEEIGYRILGDTLLQPERSNSINLDFERWHTNSYHGRLNFFYNKINNLIDYVYLGEEDSTFLDLWQSANIREAITNGFDIDITYFLQKNIEFSLGYSFLNTWDVDNESPINLKSKHKANIKLRVLIYENLNINMMSKFVGKRYYGELNDENVNIENWLDNYQIYDVSLNSKIGDFFEVNMGVKNLTDVKDPEWGPMPGREWFIGCSYSLINERKNK